MAQGRMIKMTQGGTALGFGRLLVSAVAMLATAAVAASAYAGASASPLDSPAWVANSGALLGSNVEAFKVGSKNNAKPVGINGPQHTDLAGAGGVGLLPSFNVLVTSGLAGLTAEFGAFTGGGGAKTFTPPNRILVSLFKPAPLVVGTAADGQSDVFSTNFATPALGVCETPVGTSLGSVDVFPPGFFTPPNGGPGVQLPDALGLNIAPVGMEEFTTGIFGCDTLMVGPVGVYVDEAIVEVTLLTEEDTNFGDDFLIWTHRIWVVNQFGGFVTVYEPELASELDFLTEDFFGFQVPFGVEDEPPIGGFFSTKEFDGDATVPAYIAADADGDADEVYITDDAGGFKGKGRIKAFNVFGVANCLVGDFDDGDADDCGVINQDFLVAEFDHEIAGKTTKLAIPQGIAAVNAPDVAGVSATDDEILVVNTGNNTLLEFGGGASGDVRPNTIIQGGLTGMNQPVGLAANPPFPPIDECGTFNEPPSCRESAATR